MSEFLRAKQQTLFDWLKDEWLTSGESVCFLEGFSGTGKSHLARALVQSAKVTGWKIAVDEIPHSSGVSLDNILLSLSVELKKASIPDLAMAHQSGESLPERLEQLLGDQSLLIVLDEFQHCLIDTNGALFKEIAHFLKQLANRRCRGRLLLLTNQAVDISARWAESCAFRHLESFSAEEAVAFLDQQLQAMDIQPHISLKQKQNAAHQLGCNPRAIKVLAECLRHEALEDLIETEADETGHASALLAERLERRLLQRIFERLPQNALDLLDGISVYRKAIKQKNMICQGLDKSALISARNLLIDCFIGEQQNGWFSLHPIARDIALLKLSNTPQRLKQLHSTAADHFLRHFNSEQLVNTEDLGGHFVEAEYHLIKSDRTDEITSIAQRFQAHLLSLYSGTPPVPSDPIELDRRIALLTGVLAGKNGVWGLEYHLARCLQTRNRAGDLNLALPHAQRAIRSNDRAEPWGLYIRLTEIVKNPEAALRVAKEAIDKIPVDKGLFSLYQLAAEMMERNNQRDVAISLLNKGIDKIPVDKSLFSLYRLAAEMLERNDQRGEAISLLNKGIDKIPVDKNLFALYQLAAEMLERNNQRDKVLAFLKRALDKIPTQFGILALVNSCLLQAAARQSPEYIRQIMALEAAIRPDSHPIMLGNCLLEQLQGRWEQAAKCLAGAPDVVALKLQLAFSLLCAGDSDAAQQILQNSASLKKLPDQGNPSLWLETWMALQKNDAESAHFALKRYLGRALQSNETLNTEFLLQIWQQDAYKHHEPNPAHYFPNLPTCLTGLSQPLCHPILGPKTDETIIMNKPAQNLNWLIAATEWFSRHGGISSFNRSFCEALASAGQRVICIVSEATAEEISAAEKIGVQLLESPHVPGFEAEQRLALAPDLPEDFKPDILVGHDRITGPASMAWQQSKFKNTRRLLFIHTAPAEIEWFKERTIDTEKAQRAEDRKIQQLDLAKDAHWVVAVGSRLHREFDSSLSARPGNQPTCHPLFPGLPKPLPQQTPPQAKIECLILGRAEDLSLKGLDLAAKAVGLFIKKNPRLNIEKRPALTVRGAPTGTGSALKNQLHELCDCPDLDIEVREYSADPDRLEQDIRKASVLLMPSRTEGFGLVGLEAIALGCPILISEKSGLAELLQSRLGQDEAHQHYVLPVNQDDDQNAQQWSDRLDFILRDRDAAFKRADTLRQTLAEKLSWESEVKTLLDIILNREIS